MMKINNPHNLPVRSGTTYWAGYEKYVSYKQNQFTIIPLRLDGDEPFLTPVPPSGVGATEYWLLSIANPPIANPMWLDGKLQSVDLVKKFTEYPEVHAQGQMTLENEEIVRTFQMDVVDLGIQIAPDGRVWVCVNGLAFLRFSPHSDGRMSKPCEHQWVGDGTVGSAHCVRCGVSKSGLAD